jgi:hypothetical protein
MFKIERSIRRSAVNEIYEKMRAEIHWGPEIHPREGYEILGRLEGMEILGRFPWDDPDKDLNYKCAEYVFRTIKKEPWAQVSKLPDEFWIDTITYLSERGYTTSIRRKKENLENGDVIGYGGTDWRYASSGSLLSYLMGSKTPKRYPPYLKHFGVYKEGKVNSKFDAGYIYRHDLDAVPYDYGDSVYIFRLNKP